MAHAPINLCKKQPALKGRIGWGVRSAFSFFYPDYVSEDELFAQCIARYLRADSFVLDAGCGSGRFFQYLWKHDVRLLVGCDIGDSVSQNTNIAAGVRCDLTNLPFACESFDLIFSRYVLEHVIVPGAVFTELARILKPGGKLVVLTPSKYHYVVLLSRLTPHWVHELISRIRGNTGRDTFPTRYLANSRSELVYYAEQSGLRLREFIAREMCPNYLLWSLPSFLIGVAYERVVNRFEFLSPFRVSIIAVFER